MVKLQRYTRAILLLAFSALAACNKSGGSTAATDVGFMISVQRSPGMAINQIKVSIFDDGRKVFEMKQPQVAGEPLDETEVIPVLLHGAPDGTSVTVVARGLMDGSEQDNASTVTTMVQGQYVPVTVDLGGNECASEETCNGFDANCNDLIDDGCCQPAGTWEREVVDSPGNQASIALRDGLEPYVAYHAGEDLRYAERAAGSGAWSVHSDFSTTLKDGYYPKIDLDAEGRVHIMSHVNDASAGRHLVHTAPNAAADSFDSFTWNVSNTPNRNSFAIDRANDFLHVAFISNGGYSLYQSSPVSSNSPTDPPEFLGTGTGVALCLSPAGVPHVLVSSFGSLTHKIRTTSAWVIQSSLALNLASISCVMTAEDKLVAVGYSVVNSNLVYLTHDTTTDEWTQTPVTVGESDSGHEPSLAVDSQGRAHVSFNSFSGVVYACRDHTGWTFEPVVEFGSSTVGDRAIAVGTDGCVHLVYDDAKGINYARRCPMAE